MFAPHEQHMSSDLTLTTSRHLRDAAERILHPALLLIHVISRGKVEDDVAGEEHGREDADY